MRQAGQVTSARRQWVWRIARVFTVVVGAWAVFAAGLLVAIIAYGYREGAVPADAILVLGSGLEADGSPGATLTVRAGQGATLYARGVAPLVICAGGPTGLTDRSEANACGGEAIRFGVPAKAVILEERSFNTEQNVALTLEIMAARDLDSVVVVSSRYHLLRARWFFWRQREMLPVTVTTSPAPIDNLTTSEVVYAYLREVAAFHYQVLRDRVPIPHIRVPVP